MTPKPAAHTPTPWRRGPLGGIYPASNGPLIGGCHDPKGIPIENWTADESFIVEAVNAHAAIRAENTELRYAGQAMRDTLDNFGDSEEVQRVIKQWEQAIANTAPGGQGD
jgi:hypothetical protein